MTANPFTRGTSPGRARPRHQGSFARGHAKRGGRRKGTPNAISTRARKAIIGAAKRIARGTTLTHQHWDRVVDNNPLVTQALEHHGAFTLGGTRRFRSRKFSVTAFCNVLSAVARRALQTDQFIDRDLMECLTLLGVRDPGAFARFLVLALPQQSYLAARPHAEVVEPRDAANPGEYRRPAIPEWGLGFDLELNAYIPVPIDQALTPDEAYHEVCGSPLYPKPGWDWKFDSEARRFRAIALRPKTPIPEWTLRADMTPVPVDPTVSSEQAYHNEYGSPERPAPGVQWQLNSRIERLIPTILEEPSRHRTPEFVTAKRPWLCRWHPDDGHFSLVHEDDEIGEEYEQNLYEYDAERRVFERYFPAR